MAYRELSSVYKIVAFTEAKQFGDEARIAEETGFSASHVNNVLRGRRNNTTIINKAYRLVKDRTTNLQKLSAIA
jgi:predicted transcriptional regulator